MKARARKVVCEEFRSVLLDLREAPDHHLRDPRVVALPCRAKKKVIGGIPNQGMLEGVDGRRVALPENQAQLQHQVELATHGFLRQLRDGHQQIVGELASQCSAKLEERTCLAEPVNSRHERCFHRGRDHFGGQRADEFPRVLSLNKRA